MYKGYKVRLYPTKEQEELMWKHVHACRFIWNFMLNLQEENYQKGIRLMSAFDMNRYLTKLKSSPDYAWLYGVSNASLQIVCGDLSKAYNKFFKHKYGHPKYKSAKHAKSIFPIDKLYCHYNNDSTFTVLKVGRVKHKDNYAPKIGMCNMRIQYYNGKWILSYEVKCESQMRKTSDKPMGIDLGIKELAVVAYGNNKLVFHNINKSRRMRVLEHKFKHIQRVLDRKYRANDYCKTNAIKRYETKAKEIKYKMTNIRKDYIHKTTHELVEMLPCKIIAEDLNVLGMIRNRHFSKAVREQCFNEFLLELEHKCYMNGIHFEKADRFFPSSKICSNCGKIKRDLKISNRIYKCTCGLEIDRDYNAAINLMRYVPPQKRCTA